MSRLQPESTISHYRIKELIASGGMGEVYRAVDLQLGRVVALKTIVQIKADDSDVHRRFLREARAASILSHPSICTIYEIGQEGDLTFIAMQHVAGKTIQDVLSEEQLPVETALSYALDVTEALDEAHKKGVVHRDIKPSNIMANERGIAVVLDFGLAKQVSFAGTFNEELSTLVNLTSEAAILGTVPYMSPEQIRGEPLDGRSDIFSFGITLYEMLGGALPFAHPSKIELLHAILHDEPKPLPEVRPEVDERLGNIVSKALKKDPGERYQSASELKTELLAYIQEHGFRVRGISTTSSQSRPISVPLNSQPQSATTLTGLIASPPFRRLVLILVILAVPVAVIAWLVMRNLLASEAQPVFRHVQLVNWKSEPGEYRTDAVFSGNGKIIAFSSIRGGRRDIWIKQTTMGDPNRITKGEWNSWNPIWSPDEQQIAFLSRRGNQNGVWRIPAFGGTPTLVGVISSSNVRLRSWSKSSGLIYYESYPNLFALDAASGQVRQVTSFDPATVYGDLDFSVSPDETRIAYIDRADISVMPMGGGPPVRVTNDPAEDMYPVWHPDGKRIIYTSLRDGTYQICIANLDGRAPQQVTSGESDKFVSDVSATGAQILYRTSKEESDIWRVNTDTGEESEFTSDAGVELWPDFAPDGKTIAYQSISDPGLGNKLSESLIVVKPVGSEGQQTQLAAGGIDPRWSPDGRKLAFLRKSGNKENIWTVGAAGEDQKQLTTRGVPSGNSGLPFNRTQTRFYSWSPDAGKITYAPQAPGDSNLWVVSADGSGEISIPGNSSLLLSCPLWSPDGKRIAYVSQTEVKSAGEEPVWGVWVADLHTKESEIVYQSDSVLQLLGWSVSGSEIIIETIAGKNRIWTTAADVGLTEVSPNGGGSRQIARIKSAYMLNIQLSPDGRNIAFAARLDGRDNIWLIATKGGDARKITSNNDPSLYFSSMAFSPDGKMIYFGKQSRSSLVWMIDNFK